MNIIWVFSQIVIEFDGALDKYIKSENLSDILKPDAPLRKYLKQFKQNLFKQTKDKTIYYHKF